MHTPGDDTVAVDMAPADASAVDSEESRVEVYITTDTSAAPHKADEPMLYVMYDAADPEGDKLYFTEAEFLLDLAAAALVRRLAVLEDPAR